MDTSERGGKPAQKEKREARTRRPALEGGVVVLRGLENEIRRERKKGRTDGWKMEGRKEEASNQGSQEGGRQWFLIKEWRLRGGKIH